MARRYFIHAQNVMTPTPKNGLNTSRNANSSSSKHLRAAEFERKHKAPALMDWVATGGCRTYAEFVLAHYLGV